MPSLAPSNFGGESVGNGTHMRETSRDLQNLTERISGRLATCLNMFVIKVKPHREQHTQWKRIYRHNS